MKQILAALLFIALVGCEKKEEPIDCGGLTFDFAKISEARFATSGGRVIEAKEWKGNYCFLHNRNIAADDSRRREVKSAVEYSVDGQEMGILKKPELVKICREVSIAENVSGGMSANVKLADAKGGSYRISAVYRMRHTIGKFGGALITPIKAKDGVPKGVNAPGDLSPRLEVCRFNDVWSEWVTWSKEFRIPAGCDSINIVMRIDGVGELRFKDVSIMKLVHDNPISMRSVPADCFDKTFAFSQGQCAVPVWQWKKNDPSAKYITPRFTFVLTLPQGYEFVDSTAVITDKVTSKSLLEGRTEYRLPASASYGGCVVGADFNGWNPLPMLIKASADAGNGEMKFYAEYEGKRVTDEVVTKIFAIPQIKAELPKRYDNGFYTGGAYLHFKTKAGREGFADMFTSAGATWVVQMRPDNETMQVWREKGVRYITPEWGFCANGFRVGDAAKRADEDKYVALGGGHGELSRAVCPISVYKESKHFKEDTLPLMKKFLEGCNGLWANWEPYMFTDQGCMCDRCCAEFAAYVGVAESEMKKDWPVELAYGRKWYSKIKKFRSLQHAKVVKTINKYVAKFTGGSTSLGFIPGIAWCEMSSSWRPKNLAAEVQAIDYAGSLKWIDPWGPYPWWDADTPYVKNDYGFLCYFLAAKDVRKQVDADYGNKAPKLMSFPHGVQGSCFLTQPESIALSLQSFFFNRWQSSVVYAYPKGYDARYWQAFAEATSVAAKYEDYVYDGRRCDEEVKVELDPTKPYAAPAKKVYLEYLNYAKDVSLLQHVAYELNGKTIVAVFNFADEEVAYFRLVVNGKIKRCSLGAARCKVFEFAR